MFIFICIQCNFIYILNIIFLVDSTSCLDNFDPMSAWSWTSQKGFCQTTDLKFKGNSVRWDEYGLVAFAFQSPHNLWLLDLLNYPAICGIMTLCFFQDLEKPA